MNLFRSGVRRSLYFRAFTLVLSLGLAPGVSNADSKDCAGYIDNIKLVASLASAVAKETLIKHVFKDPRIAIKDARTKLRNLVETNIESNPFLFACSEYDFEGNPDTKWWDSSTPQKDAEGNLSQDFFIELIGVVNAQIDQNLQKANALIGCLENQSSKTACPEETKSAISALQELTPIARYHLSIAQPARSFKTYGLREGGIANTSPNKKLKSPNTPKIKKWEPLSQSEMKTAQSTLDQMYQDAVADKQARVKSGAIPKKDLKSEVALRMMAVRLDHFNQYTFLMATTPALQYITSPNPDTQHLLKAMKQLRSDLEKEKKDVALRAKTINAAIKDHNSTQVGRDLYPLLNYSTELEATLLNFPEYCGLAVSLMEAKANYYAKGMLLSSALFLPVMAVSAIVTAPAAALAIGMGAGATIGGGQYWASRKESQKMERQNFTRFSGVPDYADDAISDLKQEFRNETGLEPNKELLKKREERLTALQKRRESLRENPSLTRSSALLLDAEISTADAEFQEVEALLDLEERLRLGTLRSLEEIEFKRQERFYNAIFVGLEATGVSKLARSIVRGRAAKAASKAKLRKKNAVSRTSQDVTETPAYKSWMSWASKPSAGKKTK